MKRPFLLGTVRAAASMLFTLFLLALMLPQAAEARAIDGWLAQCIAVGTGNCTEQTVSGYARQPISFTVLGSGVTVTASPYSFAQGVTGTIAGRAVYDAATGGHLLAVLPVATPYTIPSIGDRADVGSLKFTIAALASFPITEAYSGSYPAGATLGTMVDGSPVTAGTNETITRGVLAANLGTVDALPVQATLTTGFSYQIPASTSAVDVLGAGTLAAGTILLPQAPVNGQIVRLECGVTVTTLTLSPGAGATITGTAPTTCGPNASHEAQYYAANATWALLF